MIVYFGLAAKLANVEAPSLEGRLEEEIYMEFCHGMKDIGVGCDVLTSNILKNKISLTRVSST